MTNVVIKKDVPIRMRDGVILYADIYSPEGEKCPALLCRMPYNKSNPLISYPALDPIRAAREGYVVVIQDTRGRYASEGIFYPFSYEADDGYDTVEWVASQKWCNGKVGMYGVSYFGMTQWLAAIASPPHLKAIFPSLTSSQCYNGWTYQGGAFALGFNISWILPILAPDTLNKQAYFNSKAKKEHSALMLAIDKMCEWFKFLPLNEIPIFRNGAAYYYDWLSHPNNDDYWRKWDIEKKYQNITVPAYNLGGWYDIFLGGTLHNFVGMREYGKTSQVRRNQKIIIGPWHHSVPVSNVVGEVNFGAVTNPAFFDLDGLQIRWFDYWLKDIDNGIADEPPVLIFVMGENYWREEKEWPLSRTRYVNYYFHSRGCANSLYGDGYLSPEKPIANEPPDNYLYNPINPVPTKGGGLCCWSGAVCGGAFDQREMETREDVLVYTSEVLKEDIEVTGEITIILFATSSALDTDFTGKLIDVYPSGYARNLTDGIIRARYRESLIREKLIKPGKVYQYIIDLIATSNVFKKGHSIRVEISSSNFPRFDRNPNTGGIFGFDKILKPAFQTVFHNSKYASYIRLPIIPRSNQISQNKKEWAGCFSGKSWSPIRPSMGPGSDKKMQKKVL
ncbi:MAG: CocE/NonD family hydrolase [Candidatus Firestonebacteria bacterium]